MSGGDLDGDVYMCIWDEALINAVDKSMIQEPANYHKYEPDKKKTERLSSFGDHITYYF